MKKRLPDNSVYTFSNDYEQSGKQQQASVRLEIDYRNKQYSVLPCNGNTMFEFRKNSHMVNMWRAVLKSINEAIDFAEQEIIDSEKE